MFLCLLEVQISFGTFYLFSLLEHGHPYLRSFCFPAPPRWLYPKCTRWILSSARSLWGQSKENKNSSKKLWPYLQRNCEYHSLSSTISYLFFFARSWNSNTAFRAVAMSMIEKKEHVINWATNGGNLLLCICLFRQAVGLFTLLCLVP